MKLDLAVGLRPQRQDVGAGAGRRDADLLAGEFARVLDRRVGLHHEMPAVIAERRAGDVLRHHALLDAGRDRGGRIQDHVGGAGRHRLVAFRAAAIDRQLRLDAFLVEQLLAQRGLGDDGRVIGLGRQPDAHDLRLRARDRRQAERRKARGAVAEHAAARMAVRQNGHGCSSAERFPVCRSLVCGRVAATVDTLSEHSRAARKRAFRSLHAAAPHFRRISDRRRAARPSLQGRPAPPDNAAAPADRAPARCGWATAASRFIVS